MNTENEKLNNNDVPESVWFIRFKRLVMLAHQYPKSTMIAGVLVLGGLWIMGGKVTSFLG